MKIVCNANFQRRRLERALSIRDLSAASGVSANAICYAVNGRAIKPSTARKLCAALEAEFNDLFEVIDEKEVGRHGEADA